MAELKQFITQVDDPPKVMPLITDLDEETLAKLTTASELQVLEVAYDLNFTNAQRLLEMQGNLLQTVMSKLPKSVNSAPMQASSSDAPPPKQQQP